jgi:23S rRNA pseudoU1915 N3-methylase RlmH
MTRKRAAPSRRVEEEEDDEQIDDDDEEEYEFEPSQQRKRGRGASQKKTQGKQPASKRRKTEGDGEYQEKGTAKSTGAAKWSITEEEREALVSSFMRYALFQDLKKLPIKREEVNKLVLTDKHKKKKDLLPQIVTEATKRFQRIFGFELVQVDRHTQTQQEAAQSSQIESSSQAVRKKKAPAKSVTLWTLRLAKPDDGQIYDSEEHKAAAQKQALVDRATEMQRDLDAPQLGLLMIILALIQTSSGVLAEDTLWTNLRILNIHRNSPHETFGNVEKQVDTYTRQLYLEKKKDESAPDDDEDAKRKNKYVYTFGTRLAKEMNLETILRYLSETSGTPLSEATLREERAKLNRGGGQFSQE